MASSVSLVAISAWIWLRAFVDGEDQCITQELLGAVLRRIAATTVDLHARSGDVDRFFGAQVFDQRGGQARRHRRSLDQDVQLGLLRVRESRVVLLADAGSMSELAVEGGLHTQGAETADIDVHRFQVVGDHLVTVDGLPIEGR